MLFSLVTGSWASVMTVGSLVENVPGSSADRSRDGVQEEGERVAEKE